MDIKLKVLMLKKNFINKSMKSTNKRLVDFILFFYREFFTQKFTWRYNFLESYNQQKIRSEIMVDLEVHFKNEVIGAINTYINMINQVDKWEPEGKKIINKKWVYKIIDNNQTFVAKLTINGTDKIISFIGNEWRSFTSNMLGNPKLKELYDKYM
jgi:hypothetical protein